MDHLHAVGKSPLDVTTRRALVVGGPSVDPPRNLQFPAVDERGKVPGDRAARNSARGTCQRAHRFKVQPGSPAEEVENEFADARGVQA